MRRGKSGADFRQVVLETPQLAGFLCDGLRALLKVDRKRISVIDSRKIAGSINLERALSKKNPNAPLWDYCVGMDKQQELDHVKWIEVHPASSTHIDEVLKKLRWLRSWLRESASSLDMLPREFVWIASGKVHLQQGSPQIKRIAQAGLRFAGKKLVLDT